jgi:hypothetical protein
MTEIPSAGTLTIRHTNWRPGFITLFLRTSQGSLCTGHRNSKCAVVTAILLDIRGARVRIQTAGRDLSYLRHWDTHSLPVSGRVVKLTLHLYLNLQLYCTPPSGTFVPCSEYVLFWYSTCYCTARLSARRAGPEREREREGGREFYSVLNWSVSKVNTSQQETFLQLVSSIRKYCTYIHTYHREI